MNAKTAALVMVCVPTLVAAASPSAAPLTTLWYDSPAADFRASLPLGNGRIGAMVEGSDVGKGAGVGDLRSQHIAVVTAIRKQNAIGTEQPEHAFAGLAVVRLAFRQLEEDRQAVRVDDRVDLGRKPAAGTSHATTTATFFSPFAAC